MLASKAQNRRAGNVGMMNVTGEQSAEICSILARTSTTTFVHQKFYPIDITQNSGGRSWRIIFDERNQAQILALALSVEAHHFGNLAAIDLGSGKTQLFFKGLFQNGEIAVFTEDQWEYHPIISRAH